MTDCQSTHTQDCWDWGPRHYECAVGQIERDEALLRQALGALEAALSDDKPYILQSKEAVSALRAALAEQPAEQEPVGWLYEGIAPPTLGRISFQKTRETRLETRWWREIGPVYTAPQPAKSEAKDALLKQALEALEYCRSGEDCHPTLTSEAITALKERLK